jgi:hypothetical protein
MRLPVCARDSDGRCMLEVELHEATCLCKRHSDGRCMLEVELRPAVRELGGSLEAGMVETKCA